MIGSGLKKLAQKHGMTIARSIAYGNLNGYATTLSEGAGWKRIDISTQFAEAGQKEQLIAAVNAVNVNRDYRVQSFGVGEKHINIIFTDNPGTMKKIEAFIDWFYPLLAQHGASGFQVCAECGADLSGGSWYLVDGIAHHLHDSCAEHVQSAFEEEVEKRKEADTGSYVQGFFGAFIGASLGSVVWALILYAGYVASLVGLLIGWLAEKGYTLLRGRQGKGKVVILGLAVIFGVVLGTLMPDVITLAQMMDAGELPSFVYGDIPGMIVTLLAQDAEYQRAVLSNMGMGLLFAALGVFSLLKRTSGEVSTTKIKKLN